jgi:hypothetical protein
MTWMAWRQMRSAALVAAAVLLAVLVTLLVTGVHLNNEYQAYRHCLSVDCGALRYRVGSSYNHVKLIGALLIGGPAILGVFWGAPMVSRELEHGTFRLAWTQGVSRTRWIVTRIAVGALATVVVGGLLAFAFTWWAKPFDLTGDLRIAPALFDQRGFVAVAYALFGFALGVASSAVLRRTLPAMAATLVGFIGVRMIVQYLVRPHLISPLTKVVPLSPRRPVLEFLYRPGGVLRLLPDSHPTLPHAWALGAKLVDSNGRRPTQGFINQACSALLHVPVQQPSPTRTLGEPPRGVRLATGQCIHNVGLRFHEAISYQPASRFWAFQWLESAIFVGLAIALLALAVYWVRRRLG